MRGRRKVILRAGALRIYQTRILHLHFGSFNITAREKLVYQLVSTLLAAPMDTT